MLYELMFIYTNNNTLHIYHIVCRVIYTALNLFVHANYIHMYYNTSIIIEDGIYSIVYLSYVVLINYTTHRYIIVIQYVV